MRYTKLILALVFVLVLVVMVGRVQCDGYSDIDNSLVLSSDFAAEYPYTEKIMYNDHVLDGLNHGSSAEGDKPIKEWKALKDGNCDSGYTKHKQLCVKFDNRDCKRIGSDLMCKPAGSSSSSSKGSCDAPDTSKYRYKVRKERPKGSGKYKCTKGWVDTGCDWGMGSDREDKQCRAPLKDKVTDSSGAKSRKDPVRKECDKMAKKNELLFMGCKDLRGGKRTGCIGKAMPKCLMALHARDKKAYGSSNAVSATLYQDANYGGTPEQLKGYEMKKNLTLGNRVSSAKVSSGFKLHLYEHSKYKGKHLSLGSGEYPNLPPGWNDRPSSAVVKKA